MGVPDDYVFRPDVRTGVSRWMSPAEVREQEDLAQAQRIPDDVDAGDPDPLADV